MSYETKINQKSILSGDQNTILSMEGAIRSIEQLNGNELIILNEKGGIIIYNFENASHFVVQRESENTRDKRWRLLVVDENCFLTVGTYGILDIWNNQNGQFESRSTYPCRDAIFCIDWFEKEENSFFINDYRGLSRTYNFSGMDIHEQNTVSLDTNLQKVLKLDTYLVAVDYFGNVYIYNTERNFQKVTEFQIGTSNGTWIEKSAETENILIGTHSKLLLLNEGFQEIKSLDINVKQIQVYEGNDIILTYNDVIKIDYSKTHSPKKIKNYLFKKIALVGDSQTGKTSFCKYLSTGDNSAPPSTYGTHLWSIPIEESKENIFTKFEERRILYLDLAGQEEEHFTYFPKIYNYDIILIFFHCARLNTFENALNYYKELNPKCIRAKFYFIMTHSDQMQRVLDSTIRHKFEEIQMNIDSNLIRLDNSSGNGFEDYSNKVVSQIQWEDAPIIYRLPLFDDIESIIHSFYLNGVEELNIEELTDPTNLDTNRLEGIIESYYKQGYLDYIKEEDLIIINNERYAQIQSLIANVIVQNNGRASSDQILDEISGTDNDEIFIRNILQYYRDNQIGAIFGEERDRKEIFIFPRKLPDIIGNKNELPIILMENLITFQYKDVELDIIRIISFLNSLPLDLVDISKEELILVREGTNDEIKLYIQINKPSNDGSTFICNFGMIKNDLTDIQIEEKLLLFIWKELEEHIIDYTINESESYSFDSMQNDIDLFKQILNHKCERPYLDYKNEISLQNGAQKAECIKDIIALTNMAYLNNNQAFLIIGIEEKDCKIKNFNNIENTGTLEQQLSQLIENYINFGPNFNIIEIRINQIFKWQQVGEITSEINIPFEFQTDQNNDKIIFIKFQRTSNRVCENKNDFNFQNKRGRPDKYDRGVSWMRIGSHSIKINEQQRLILREKD